MNYSILLLTTLLFFKILINILYNFFFRVIIAKNLQKESLGGIWDRRDLEIFTKIVKNKCEEHNWLARQLNR